MPGTVATVSRRSRPVPGNKGWLDMGSLLRWIRRREQRRVQQLGASALLKHLQARHAGLLLGLPLYWLSYPAVAFDLFDFDPAAEVSPGNPSAWLLIAVLGLHLGLCHWSAQRLPSLGGRVWRHFAPQNA